MQRHLWTILSERVAYQNPWIQVIEYDVLRPDGQPGLYGVVDAGHYAGVVAIDERNRVALLHEFVFPVDRFLWQIPSGQFRGERPVVAAARELREETGIVAQSWTELGLAYLSAGISTQETHLFLARDLSVGEAEREPTETMTVSWLPLEDAVDMCLRGEITDAVSVMGLLKAFLWMREEERAWG
ncbi:NUDIX domain-containing protein [Alicyclobacillus vulcanalis]|uniref:ADP-ribose pyrophosphatase YjhB, NUDIX family n=1 Tax=Alicyclobacillus vulcanalis TaxID=252246 RepID=A0A1N7PU95_9BACL|nr:NUDIX hydrolase [Alicyclobacillus vulcanalis]SIT14132.1 ADP-ribose pyrophosphatase YjhB, NUDIX family [Alicyclobacillus vulcanalis]